jgi:glycosyltransferase involved in cell wall biosynthesis
MIDISVIIPVYNAAGLLKRCLDSILAQKGGYSYEVLLVDDGSTDNSVGVIESYKNPCFKIFRQKNIGPSVARNKGIKEARGKYIAFIDADDYWGDCYIAKTVGFLDQYEDCVAASVVCKNITVSGKCYNPNCYYEEEGIGLVNNESGDSTHTPFILNEFYTYWANYCHVGTCSTTMKADVAKQVLMREDLRISEDYEFWLLLASYGKWGIIPEPLYVSDGTGTLVNQEAWIARMKRRWENAPAIEVWERRIIERKPELKENASYRYAIGRVSRNLTYCQLLSGRTALARSEAMKYGAYFTKDAIGKLMNIAKWTPLTWWGLCKFLKYREYHRFK